MESIVNIFGLHPKNYGYLALSTMNDAHINIDLKCQLSTQIGTGFAYIYADEQQITSMK